MHGLSAGWYPRIAAGGSGLNVGLLLAADRALKLLAAASGIDSMES